MKSLSLHHALSAMTVAAAALLASAPAAAQTNLIDNGSFDLSATGNDPFLFGWDVQYTQDTFVQVTGGFDRCIGGMPNTCLYVKNSPLSLGQNFVAAAGQALQIKADYFVESSAGETLTMSYNGVELFATSTATAGWQSLVFNVVSDPVAHIGNRLDFQFNSSGFNGTFMLDNVSVTAVPEPAAMTLFAIGLAGLAAARRVRRSV